MSAVKKMLELNAQASKVFAQLVDDALALKVEIQEIAGATLVDCGINAPGGLEAGRRLAELCLAGLGTVSIVPASSAGASLGVCVRTDHPVAACLASQYAGWRIAQGDFFAMASGPMRAVAGREELFDKIGFREAAPGTLVGVMETSQLPTVEVIESIAESCHVSADRLLLAAAPTTSLAGCLQISARSVETALHKLEQLDFDLARIVSGFGQAPLPDPTPEFVEAIGRTNDAILYHSEVTLWVRGDDASLAEITPQVPSSASPDHGRPFADIFRGYNGDFYQIDPLLFSPAVVRLVNIETGTEFLAGMMGSNAARQT
ncbi:MAG: methenyltetrahydromethanopterin cyclohydrolase [Pirellulales bacterium]|nr:methenyltetrahydromethanopterin cyclohydrolase [Pirellulales bacterium]